MSQTFGSGSNEVNIQYCGGWGYKSKCQVTLQKLNETFGEDKFTHNWHRDAAMTGNFEITVNGTAVWSKKATGAFPQSNWDKFLDDVKAAMKWETSSEINQNQVRFWIFSSSDRKPVQSLFWVVSWRRSCRLRNKPKGFSQFNYKLLRQWMPSG